MLKHGCSHRGRVTKEYRVWADMIARCYIESSTSFPDYGGRGIQVDPRWRNDFPAFLQDMGLCPAGMSIERNDNSANYEPNNCSWATKTEQANNRRKNSVYRLSPAEAETIRCRAAKGETRKAIAKIYGVNPSSITRIINGERYRKVG